MYPKARDVHLIILVEQQSQSSEKAFKIAMEIESNRVLPLPDYRAAGAHPVKIIGKLSLERQLIDHVICESIKQYAGTE